MAKEGHPDPTQFDKKHDHFDPDSPLDEPRWFQVEVRGVRKLAHPVTLERMKADPQLRDLPLLRRGNRLSVQPVPPECWKRILELSKTAG